MIAVNGWWVSKKSRCTIRWVSNWLAKYSWIDKVPSIVTDQKLLVIKTQLDNTSRCLVQATRILQKSHTSICAGCWIKGNDCYTGLPKWTVIANCWKYLLSTTHISKWHNKYAKDSKMSLGLRLLPTWRSRVNTVYRYPSRTGCDDLIGAKEPTEHDNFSLEYWFT